MINLAAKDNEIFTDIMKEAPVGHLGLVDASGYPRVVPLNFVFVRESIYFHGGKHGEKYHLLSCSPKVTFSVDVPYALIPSYWVNADRGCSITQFFKSVLIRGQGQLVEDLGEKILVLQALMDKFQPEGNYQPLNPDNPMYGNVFEKVTIVCIKIEQISVKYYFGQRLDPSKLNQICHNLEKRDMPLDRATLLEIKNLQSGSAT